MTLSATTTAPPPQSVLLRFCPAVLIIFCGYLTVGLPLAALPLQVHDGLGFGNLAVGMTIGLQSLATLLTRQFAGGLCDRKGPKLSVLLGGGVSVTAGVLYLLSALVPMTAKTSLGVLLAGRAALGAGESLLMTGGLAWAIGVVSAQNTGKVMVWVGIGMYGAVAAGAPLGIHLMTGHIFGGGFVVVAIGTIVFSMIATGLGALLSPIAAIGGERLPFIKVAGRIAPYGAGLALATLGFGAIAAFAALDFQRKGWNGAGFALTGFGSAYILTRLIFGGWPDRFGGARVAACSLLVECIGQVLLWLAPAAPYAFVGAILTGTGFSLVFPSFGIEAVRQVSAANRGAALGAYVAFFDMGFAVAGPITGLIAGAFGYPSVFAAGALGAMAAIVLARSNTTKRPAPNAEE
jgi:MFS family permease